MNIILLSFAIFFYLFVHFYLFVAAGDCRATPLGIMQHLRAPLPLSLLLPALRRYTVTREDDRSGIKSVMWPGYRAVNEI